MHLNKFLNQVHLQWNVRVCRSAGVSHKKQPLDMVK